MRSNRLTEMEQYIRNNETVSLEALCDEFNISMNTVRRDVALLVERGNVEKILGGVRSTSLQPASFQMRTRYLFAQKQRIGYAAAALVTTGMSFTLAQATHPYRSFPALQIKRTLPSSRITLR